MQLWLCDIRLWILTTQIVLCAADAKAVCRECEHSLGPTDQHTLKCHADACIIDAGIAALHIQ